MNKACLIKGHNSGLGSLINNAMMWSFEYDRISIDWSPVIYGPNTWYSLFAMLPPPEGRFDDVVVYPESAEVPTAWLTWRWAAMLYRGENAEHSNWREDCNAKWEQHFHVRPDHLAWTYSFAADHFKKRMVAAQIRWHGHSGEQIAPHRSLTWEEIADAVDKEIDGDPDAGVYVAAGDHESIEWFKARFPGRVVWHPTARRSKNRDVDCTKDFPLTEQDAVDALQEILLIARCDALVHVISNLATVALYIRPVLKSIYLP